MNNAEKRVSMDEAQNFMNAVESGAKKVALGVSLCILSPVLLIYLVGLLDGNITDSVKGNSTGTLGGSIRSMLNRSAERPLGNASGGTEGAWNISAGSDISPNFAVGLGVSVLLIMVAIGVLILLRYDLAMKRYAYLDREMLLVDDDAAKIVMEKRDAFAPSYRKIMGTGVALCIICAVPIMMAVAFEAKTKVILLCVDCVLLVVALGVYLIVWSSMIEGSYDRLLEEGDYTRTRKLENSRNEILGRIYWCTAVLMYLGYSFFTADWHISWVVWPLAGVLYVIVTGIASIVRR